MNRATLFAALLLACGGDAPGDVSDTDDTDVVTDVAIAGLYRITSDQVAPDCGAFTEAVLPIPFYRIVGVPGGIEVRTCRSESDCNDYADAGMVLQPADAGFKSVITWSHWQIDGESCVLDARRTTLKSGANDTIELASTQVETSEAPPGEGSTEACAEVEQDWTPTFQSDTLSCWKREATRVE